jgi:ribonuclease HII
MPSFDYENRLWEEGKIITGIDEVGRGCLAGPVVSAAVILNKDANDKDYLELINDSKAISESKRELVFNNITKDFEYSVDFIDNNVIDEINILQASILSMKNSVSKLKTKPDHLLIDGNRFTKYSIDYTLIIKGDSISYSIAAASIVAKVTRDKYMVEVADKLYPEYGFGKHKGYATKYHRNKIVEFGVCPIHRRTFLNKILSNQQKIF